VTHVAILAGDSEYGSQDLMRMVERDLLALPGRRVSYWVADVVDDAIGADVLVVYTRWLELPDAQMRSIAEYLDRGGAVVGLRTSTHAFRFADGSPWAAWNDGFGRDVLGTPWVSHHGHRSRTVVTRPAGVDHPILDGLAVEKDVARLGELGVVEP
jgi:uncharacterized protein